MASLWFMLEGQQICCQCRTVEEAYFIGAALFLKPLPYLELIRLTSIKSIIIIGMDLDFHVRFYLGHWYPPDKTTWEPSWLTFITSDELKIHPLYLEKLEKIKQYRIQEKLQAFLIRKIFK